MEKISIDILDKKGKSVGKIELPNAIFGLDRNDSLVHQVYTIKRGNQRKNYAHTKDRSEVRGGGRKPWRQKGTGRARHGSRRSPIWSGGGVTFGPRNETNFSKKLNKKMNQKAVSVVLSLKNKDKNITVFDSLSFDKPNTKSAKEILSSVKLNDNSTIIFGSQEDVNFVKSFRNIENITPRSINRISIIDLLNHKGCVFSKNALELLIKNYADINKHSQKSEKGQRSKQDSTKEGK